MTFVTINPCFNWRARRDETAATLPCLRVRRPAAPVLVRTPDRAIETYALTDKISSKAIRFEAGLLFPCFSFYLKMIQKYVVP